MITREQAKTAARDGTEFHYTGRTECRVKIGPRGGRTETVTRCRVSGQCKVWKRDQNAFRLPVKYGLYESSAIDEQNAGHFHRAEDCPAGIR